jgi:hypothetical protein
MPGYAVTRLGGCRRPRQLSQTYRQRRRHPRGLQHGAGGYRCGARGARLQRSHGWLLGACDPTPAYHTPHNFHDFIVAQHAKCIGGWARGSMVLACGGTRLLTKAGHNWRLGAKGWSAAGQKEAPTQRHAEHTVGELGCRCTDSFEAGEGTGAGHARICATPGLAQRPWSSILAVVPPPLHDPGSSVSRY